MNFYSESDCMHLVTIDKYFCIVSGIFWSKYKHKDFYRNSKLIEIGMNQTDDNNRFSSRYLLKDYKFNNDFLEICCGNGRKYVEEFEQKIGHKFP